MSIRAWTAAGSIVTGTVMVAFMTVLPARAAASNPVVVELFESQGCSSCPPSEWVMTDLRREFGSSVIPLTFHVHYWDYLGWKDPFSDPRYTERQKMYAGVFQQDSIYTPEMVVQGESGFIGSDGGRAMDEVRKRLDLPRSPVTLKAVKENSGAAVVSVQLPADLAKGVREVMAVVYEDAPPVHVLRGENAGATMSGDSAVRAIVPVPVDSAGRGSVTIPLKRPWDSAKLNVVVLVRGDSAGILSAASIPWPDKGL